MKKQILTIALFILVLIGFSQNYRCINSNTIHYFEDAETIKVIHIDSVVAEGSNLIYYNYPTFALTDEWYCYTQYGPSWIGRQMLEKPNGDNIFYNLENEPITIKTLSDLGDEWLCYEFTSGNYITASFSEIESMEFLGITDMVKKITFQAKDVNGSSISHSVNNMYLLLSENHGLIRTINFKLFPDLFDEVWYSEICQEYELSGIEGNDNGIHNLSIEQIFDMNVGDKYHTEEYSYMMGMHIDMKLMINTIISKEVSTGNDTIFYEAERCGKREYQYDTVFTITYFQDTVELTYNLQSFSNLDTIPEKIIVDGDEEYREYSYNTQWRLNNSDRLIKENWFGFHSTFPHDCIEMIITKNPGLEQFYFVEGLAGPYWYHEDILNWENYRKLLYYKTATEEWGEPLNCDSLLIGIKENLIQNQKIHLYPNPASGYINISIAENSIFEISFYKVEGQKILSIKSPDKTIDISDLKPGLYFAEIKTSEGDVMRKIVVQ